MSALARILYPLPLANRLALNLLFWGQSRRLFFTTVVGGTGLLTLVGIHFSFAFRPRESGVGSDRAAGRVRCSGESLLFAGLGWILTLSAFLAAGCAAPREAPPDTMQVRVVFSRNEEPHPVLREVPRTEGVLRAALEALLRGPTMEERAEGISSWFSPETANFLNHVTIDAEGNALVDFADFRAVIPGASTSAGSAELLWALNGTVFQFETVRTVDYRINGSCEAFWHFLQTECLIVERPPDLAP